MRTATDSPVTDIVPGGHEALPMDCAERAAIRTRINAMVWAGERAAIRTRIGSLVWVATTLDEDAAEALAERILEFVEARLPERKERIER